ncbi:MAG: UDP-N-acetylmuramoyl-L-alanyl-D-glutamate--2,6-diaminopimelate ligase [Eubacterium sp.]|nr:UDP-N-acetylmuramoyl-L-alanyl-D-glutamate--2,6-diaminopimelate ligase [Eubacterium sp.]
MSTRRIISLEKILEGLSYELLQGDLATEVVDLAYDSRKVTDGFMFVAIAGTIVDGHKFIGGVIEQGASAIVVERSIDAIRDEYGIEIPAEIAVIKVDNARAALSLISQNYFDHPMKKMTSIGITGTKGKSTTTYLIKNILEQTGKKCGIIGTIGVAIGDQVTPIEHTTPESYDLQSYIADIAEAGCEYFVMEVSSQGVKMDRVAGMVFDYGIFTNITPDHIGENEHEDFNDYLHCKAALFDRCHVGIFNADDPHTAGIIRGAHCLVKTYGIWGQGAKADDETASDITDEQYLAGCEEYTGKRDLMAVEVNHVNEKDVLAMKFGLRGLINSEAMVGLPGLFNVYNALCAVTLGALVGVDDAKILKAIQHVEVRGRVEAVPTGRDFSVLIDFAHNGVSTESVLKTLRGYQPHRLIAIFGCGGNRSKLRRYEMGEAVGKLADYAVVTSDNPRTEQFADIVEDIKVGLSKTDLEYTVIEDRMEAVAYAVAHAESGDMIVLLGKGHEEYQEIQGVKHHYSEREAVAAALAAL